MTSTVRLGYCWADAFGHSECCKHQSAAKLLHKPPHVCLPSTSSRSHAGADRGKLGTAGWRCQEITSSRYQIVTTGCSPCDGIAARTCGASRSLISAAASFGAAADLVTPAVNVVVLVELGGQRSDHVDAFHQHVLAQLLDRDVGFPARDEFGDRAAVAELRLGLHRVGMPMRSAICTKCTPLAAPVEGSV